MNFVDCHEEPIHIPGYIQDFGYLIGLDVKTKTVRFHSQNITDIFEEIEGEKILGKRLEDFHDVFLKVIWSDIYKNLEDFIIEKNEIHQDKIFLDNGTFHISIYRNDKFIFLEFEKVLDHFYSKEKLFTSKYENIYNAKTEHEIWEELLKSFQQYIDYDRMMIYKFLSDGSGKVIAEKTKENVESFLHLHYPESDIPRQAKALYLKKRKRIFSNVYSEPVPILSDRDEIIDLTYSTVRAMSPIHGEYLKNTGVSSSFSTSIIVNNRLWGLVTCQNIEPKHIDVMNRVHAEVVTILASNAYYSLKNQEEIVYRQEASDQISEIRNDFLKHKTLTESISHNLSQIQQFVEADGIALVSGDQIYTEGLSPSEKCIEKITKWALENVKENIFIENRFVRNYGESICLESHASGIIISIIDRSRKELLIWFREEFQDHINWAGNPEKNIKSVLQNGVETMIVSPRTSFKIFTENTKGISKPWKRRQRIAAENIHSLILETSYSQYSKIQELNKELKNLNEELDSFSYTISHDLGTPLTVMKLNAQMLLRGQKEEKAQKKIKAIIDEISGMEELMTNVLELSRAKKTDLQLESIETKNIITKISEDAKIQYKTPETKIKIKDCPNVLADKTMLQQVFQNIITNAVKYSSKTENPKVKISGEILEDEVVYRISDNGIGIEKEDKEKMFKIFARMDNAKPFKGTGVGLSIVQRIMNRIGGKVEYESEKGKGTTFILTFQKG